MKALIFVVGFLIVYSIGAIKKKRKKKAIEKKGEAGEKEIEKILQELPRKYKVFNNVLLKKGDNYSQIDHIVVSKRGIGLIETKNYSGYIYGKEEEKYWTQVLAGKKNKFYNPIWQNNSHKAAIKSNFKEIQHLPVYEIVVFLWGCELKSVKVTSKVIYPDKLKKSIKGARCCRKLTRDEINYIADKLEKINVNTKKNRKKHVKYIKAIEK